MASNESSVSMLMARCERRPVRCVDEKRMRRELNRSDDLSVRGVDDDVCSWRRKGTSSLASCCMIESQRAVLESMRGREDERKATNVER